MNRLLTKTKRGGASMFVVMFAIVILAIITLSFTRLIISEATKTSNTDLSQSAYDAALAGVEDAKIALLRYHACLDQGYNAGSGGTCGEIIKNMQEGIKTNDCSTVQKVLGRELADNHGVVVQETQTSSQAGNNANMLQAYTCVTIKEDLEDYRTTLDSTSRLRIIPIRSSDIDSLGYINVKWYNGANKQKQAVQWCDSDTDGDGITNFYTASTCDSKKQSPPMLTVRLIQTDKTFNLSELSVARKENQTDVGQLTLIPSDKAGTLDKIESNKWSESANKGDNYTELVHCDKSAEWVCDINLQMPNTFNGSTERHAANTYLVLSIPYGAPETDISIRTYAAQDNRRFDFTGIQARIDSTGRANDLYRRVETRVELVDTSYAYPEFEITMVDGAGPLEKLFYVTFDCIRSDHADPSSGLLGPDPGDNDYNYVTCVNSKRKESFGRLKR